MPDLRASILDSLGSVALKPNKLRKVVVAATKCDWTEFAKALDGLKAKGTVEETELDGAVHVRIAGSEATVSAPAASSSAREESVMLPHAVALNLRRKGRKKLKNIEETTKTRIKLAPFVDNKGNTETQVCATLRADGDEEESSRRIKACKLFLDKMGTAFQKNPERFTRKAGGTLDEQETQTKRPTPKSSPKKARDGPKDEEAPTGTEAPKKKRKREGKFF